MSEPEAAPIATAKPAGKVQVRVVDCLKSAGRWRWLADVVAELFPDATRSQVVVVRNAVRTLADRGEICIGNPAAASGEVARKRAGRKRQAVWLPTHVAPPVAKPLPTRQAVAGAIVEFLGSLDERWASHLRHQWRKPAWTEDDDDCFPEPLDAPWPAVSLYVLNKFWTKEERKALGITTAGNLIRRALADLRRDGQVRVVRSYNSDQKRSYTIFIGLGQEDPDGSEWPESGS